MATEPDPSAPVDEARFVFNLVWTGDAFTSLQVFTASVLAHSGARLRFVANACPPDQLAAMERFGDLHPGRVVEVLEVSSRRMIRHGDALDAVRHQRDDGELFCFMDPDILARGPFLPGFAPAVEAHAAVTSGRDVWSDDNVRPAGHIGVNGEIFYDRDGFVFGCPHFAIYRRAVLDEVSERWDVGFGVAGEREIPAAAWARLEEVGRRYWVYDTAKVVNILLQADGHSLVHRESPDLVHVGGVSHFLAPPMTPEGETPRWGENVRDWGRWEGQEARYAAASYAAGVLRAVTEGHPAPDVPATVSPDVQERLERLRADVEAAAATARPGAPDGAARSRATRG